MIVLGNDRPIDDQDWRLDSYRWSDAAPCRLKICWTRRLFGAVLDDFGIAMIFNVVGVDQSEITGITDSFAKIGEVALSKRR
jgi:hypothetical protein